MTSRKNNLKVNEQVPAHNQVSEHVDMYLKVMNKDQNS